MKTRSFQRPTPHPFWRYILVLLIVITWITPPRVECKEIQNILTELEAYINEQMAAEKVPGLACAIVKDGEIIYAKGFGVKKYGVADPVDENTVFEIGSNSKAFGVAVAGTLVEQGAMNWTDPVTLHLPDFKMHESWVTKTFQIEDLMCHRSGMPGYSLDTMWTAGYPVEEVMKSIRYVEPVSSFRTSFAYQNNLYIWLGKLIETKTGARWPDVVKERIFTPLGMTQTAAGETDTRRWSNIAVGHLILGGGTPWPQPSDWRYNRFLMTSVGPAGDIRSNVFDMVKWMRLHLGNGTFDGKTLLKPDTMQYIHSPRTPVSSTSSESLLYAMGLMYDARSPYPYLWHTGGTLGMLSFVGFIPGVNIGMVVLTNSVDHNVHTSVFSKFYELYFGLSASPGSSQPPLLDAKPEKTLTASLPSSNEQPLPSGRYVGTYKNPAYGKAVIKQEGSSLVLSLGPEMIEGTLTPQSDGTFVWAVSDWPELEMKVTFTANPYGRVSSLAIDQLKDVKGGTFVRSQP